MNPLFDNSILLTVILSFLGVVIWAIRLEGRINTTDAVTVLNKEAATVLATSLAKANNDTAIALAKATDVASQALARAATETAAALGMRLEELVKRLDRMEGKMDMWFRGTLDH